jgi:hypothetical protein
MAPTRPTNNAVTASQTNNVLFRRPRHIGQNDSR